MTPSTELPLSELYSRAHPGARGSVQEHARLRREAQCRELVGLLQKNRLSLGKGLVGASNTEKQSTEVDAQRRVSRIRCHGRLYGADHPGVGSHPLSIVRAVTSLELG